MRILIIEPGFQYSTLAVAQGYYNAFKKLGYEVMSYDMLNAVETAKRGVGKIVNKVVMNEISEFACAPILNTIILDKIDVVLMVHGYFMNPAILTSIRGLGCKTGIILTDDPMQIDASVIWSHNWEYIFTNERRCEEIHRINNRNSYYLPVAVDDIVFPSIDNVKECESDILVAGSFYEERVELLSKIKDTLLKYNTKFVGAKNIKFPDESLENLCVKNRITYEEMAKWIVNSKISIDIPKNEFNDGVFGETNKQHIRATCLSPRIFECAISRRRFITNNDRADIRLLFDKIDGVEIQTFDEPKELAIKLEQTLAWDKEQGNLYLDLRDLQEYVQKNHTYLQRAEFIQEKMNIIPSKKEINRNVVSVINDHIEDVLTKDWEENFNIAIKNKWYEKGFSLCNLKDMNKNLLKEISIISNGPSLECFPGIFTDGWQKLYLNEANKFIKCSFDWSMLIHPSKDVYERCFKDLEIKTPLITSTLACGQVINKWLSTNQPVYFFNTGDGPELKRKVSELTHYPILEAGYTVGYSAITVALYLGFKKINLYGLDFCYLNNKKYAWEKELSINQWDSGKMILVPTIKDGVVFTNELFLKSRDACLNLIERNSEIEFNVYGNGILYSKKLKNLHNIER